MKARSRLLVLLLLLLTPSFAQDDPGPFTGNNGTTVEAGGAEAPAAPGDVAPKPQGEYYGNSLGGIFGGRPYEAPGVVQPLDNHGSMFRSGRSQRRLTFSGFADLTWSAKSVTGASETFSQDQYGKDQSFAQNASLLVSGPVWKWANLNVHAQVEQRSFGFNDTRPVWRVYWEEQNNRVTVGDISPSLGDDNEFVPFSRRMRGIQAEGRAGQLFEYLVFGSQVEGSIRSETFVGDGTAGPYFLTYTPIVDGSSVVVVDGVIQQPGYGDTGDYTLNPSTGELLFNGTTIIPPTSRIEVRYETQGGGGPKDLLVGTRMSFRPFRSFQFGISYLGQLAAQSDSLSGPTEERVTDTITVPTPSSGPFTVRPRPIVVGSESVQVNGILQQRDIDYEISYESGELQFFQVLPEGTTILVRFSVIQDVDLGAGDRTILGLDGGLSLGDLGSLQFELARSQGISASVSNPYSFTGSSNSGYNSYGGYNSFGGYNSYSGGLDSQIFGTNSDSGSIFNNGSSYSSFRARAATRAGGFESRQNVLTRQTTTTQAASGDGGSAYKLAYAAALGDLQFGLQYKAVSDNFSRIDSTGFFQNERGLAMQAQYSTGQRFSIGHQYDTYSRPGISTTDENGDPVVGPRVKSTLNYTTVSWRVLPNSNLTFMHNAQSNSGGSSANTLSREAITLSHRFSNQFQFNAGIDHAKSGTSGSVTGSTQVVSNDSDSTSGRVGVSYSTSGGAFGTRLDYSFSGTKSSTARNRSSSTMLSLNYQPFSWLSSQFSHQLSSSRNESLVGTSLRQAGVGVFDDTGDTSTPTDPLTGDSVTTNTIQDSKTQNSNLSLSLSPTRNLSLTTSFGHNVTDTGRLAGSTNDSWQTNLHWQATERMGFGVGYNTQWLDYSETGDKTTTGIINFNFDWRLSNHLDARFDLQRLTTRNSLGPREDGTDAATLGLSPSSLFSSWGLDLRWQLPGRGGHTWFTSLRSDKSSGGSSTDFKRMQLETGWDIRLTDILGGQLSYTYTNYDNHNETADNSYVAHLWSAGLGLRF